MQLATQSVLNECISNKAALNIYIPYFLVSSILKFQLQIEINHFQNEIDQFRNRSNKL